MAYDAAMSMTDAESFAFEVEIADPTVNLFQFKFSYALKGCGIELAFGPGNGLTVDVTERLITIAADPDFRLPAGTYEHGLISTETATDKVMQLFTGTVTVTRSPNA